MTDTTVLALLLLIVALSFVQYVTWPAVKERLEQRRRSKAFQAAHPTHESYYQHCVRKAACVYCGELPLEKAGEGGEN